MHQKFHFLVIFLFFSFPSWGSNSFDEEKFLENVRLYAKNPDNTFFISREENSGAGGITCIKNNEGSIYAVLKRDEIRSKREPFAYAYLKHFGLGSTCAPSVYVDDLELPTLDGETTIYQGAVEKYILAEDECVVQDGNLRDFIDWMADWEAVNLLKCYNKMRINYNTYNDPEDIKKLEKNKQWLLEFFNGYIDVEAAHKCFSAFILMNLSDATHRNLCFRVALDSDGKDILIPVGFDNENYFSYDPRRLTAILNFEVSCKPLHPSVSNLILSWSVEDLCSYKGQIEALNFSDRYAVENQCQRISDLQSFITLYPKASPRDILLYAFFNTPLKDRDGEVEDIYGINLLSGLSFGGFQAKYNISYDHLGNYFKDPKGFSGLKFAYERFQRKYYGYGNLFDESSSSDGSDESDSFQPREVKTFSDFINYLLNEDPEFIGTIDDLKRLGLMGAISNVKNKIALFETLN